MWIVWLILAGFFFFIEILTVGFLIFWLGLGALLAMAISFLTDNLFIQIGLFVISSTIFIIFTKPLLKKFLKTEEIKTNTSGLVGKKAIVIEDIDNIQGKGKAKIGGEVWTVKTYDDTEKIVKDTEVEILGVTGVKLLVTANKSKYYIKEEMK